MPSPLLSVLMPVHNAQSTLGQAISSCLNAMPESSELLIYFDGCTDGSLGEVDKFDDSRIRKFIFSQNLGVTQARRFLVAHARGEFVATFDADDICLPWRFSVALSQLSKRNLDFFFSNAIFLTTTRFFKYFAPQFRPNLKPDNFALALAINSPVVHSTLVARRESVVEVGSYLASRAEDYELYLRASLADKKMFRYWVPTVIYRKHPYQLSQQSVWDSGISTDPSVVKSYSALVAKLGIFLPDGTPFSGSHLTNVEIASDILRRAGKRMIHIRIETILRRMLGRV
jgi:glycosyltransferase involved in cell wall biosynthesis